MKKIAYILISAFAVFTVACTGNSQQDAEKNQKKIDSTVQAFVDSKKGELKKMCDDQLMAAAQDSAKLMMEKSKKGGHAPAHHTTKPVVKADPPKSTTPAPNTNTGKKTDAAAGTNTGKKTETNQASGVNMGKKH